MCMAKYMKLLYKCAKSSSRLFCIYMQPYIRTYTKITNQLHQSLSEIHNHAHQDSLSHP